MGGGDTEATINANWKSRLCEAPTEAAIVSFKTGRIEYARNVKNAGDKGGSSLWSKASACCCCEPTSTSMAG